MTGFSGLLAPGSPGQAMPTGGPLAPGAGMAPMMQTAPGGQLQAMPNMDLLMAQSRLAAAADHMQQLQQRRKLWGRSGFQSVTDAEMKRAQEDLLFAKQVHDSLIGGQ